MTTRQEAIINNNARFVRTANGATWDRIAERLVPTVESGFCPVCLDLVCETPDECEAYDASWRDEDDEENMTDAEMAEFRRAEQAAGWAPDAHRPHDDDAWWGEA